MTVKIERATLNDIELLVALQKRAFYECYQRYQDHDLSPYNVTAGMMQRILEQEQLYKISFNHEIVGAIYVHENPDKTHMKLHGIFVVPEHQDKGLGQRAIKYVEAQCPEARIWELETPHDLKRNHHLYEKLGYRRTGVEETVNDRLSIIHYRKTVAQE